MDGFEQDPKPKKEIQKQVKNNFDKDYEYTRRELKDIIATTKPVLEHASDVALEGAEPRQFEVVSGLAKSLGDLAKAVMESSKIKKEIDEKNGELPQNMVQNNNTIYVGSTKELLDAIESSEESDIIDAQPIPTEEPDNTK